MKPFSRSRLLPLSLLALLPLIGGSCASTSKKTAGTPVAIQTTAAKSSSKASSSGKSSSFKKGASGDSATDALDDYDVVQINDPLEKLNRGTFWVNDKLYLVIFRPLGKGYEKIMPKRARKGIDNAFENVKFPVRLVNSLLQGKIKGAGQQTEKFLVNTVAGVGGLYRVSEHIPSLAELPDEDTGKTFAKWGMGHGAYIVIPFLGPSSVRDGVGLIGDYAMNPVNWGYFWGGEHDWTMIPPYANTLRALPANIGLYDDAKKDAIDPYIAIRSAYVQYRDQFVKK